MEINNYQWRVFLLNIFQIQLILVAIKKSEVYSYISDSNEKKVRDSHAHMFHLLKYSVNLEY